MGFKVGIFRISPIANSSIIKSYGSVLEAPRRDDSNTDAKLMIIVTIL